MAQVPADLGAKQKVLRNLLHPIMDCGSQGQSIKAAVDFCHFVILGIKGKIIFGFKLFRIKLSFPAFITPPGSANMDISQSLLI